MMRYTRVLLPAAVLSLFSAVCFADIANGGFETGDFTGWTPGGDLSQPWNAFVSSNGAHSGTYAAHFGAFGNQGDANIMTQSLVTTPGTFYEISFWYGEYNANDPLAQPYGYLLPSNISTDPANPYSQANELSVFWDNGVSPVFQDADFFTSDHVLTGFGDFFYQHGTFTVEATNATSVLQFGAFDRQQDVILDDVTITALGPNDPAQVPEPGSLASVAVLLVCLGVGLQRRRARV